MLQTIKIKTCGILNQRQSTCRLQGTGNSILLAHNDMTRFLKNVIVPFIYLLHNLEYYFFQNNKVLTTETVGPYSEKVHDPCFKQTTD